MIQAKRRTVLLLPEGNYLSHVSRLLVIGRNLRAEGLRVVFACGGRFAPMVKRYGFSCHPLLTSGTPGQMERARKYGCYYDNTLVRAYVDAELECMSRIRPDLVVSDMRPTTGISTELLGIDHCALVNTYLTRFDASPLEPPRTMPLARMLGRSLYPGARTALLRMAARPFNRERRRWGLAPWRDVLDALLGRTLTLLADHPDFFPVRALPSNIAVIGPILWQPDAAGSPGLPALDPSTPVLYFSCGSTGRAGLLGHLVDALGGMPIQVIVGGSADQLLPARFHALPMAPGIDMARRSDLVVCHGGNGTVYQALSAGRPVVAVPRFYEQEFNVHRIEQLGLGKGLWKVTASKLRETIQSVLESPKYRARAERFADLLQGTDAGSRAGRLIAEHLGAIRRLPARASSAPLLERPEPVREAS